MSTYKESVSGSLFVPRVKVEWGTEGRDFVTESIFYDVRVSLQDQGQNPTGSMKLRPEPKALDLYEDLVSKFRYWTIVITYYYIGGKSISFEFFWGGQSETFGNRQEITVKLVTLLDGLVNANYYASALADRKEQGISFVDAQKKLTYFFGIDKYPSLIRYTPKAREDCSKSIVKMNYNDGATFNDALQNLVRENGNSVFFNNIGSSNGVIYTPYTWESDSAGDLPTPGWRTDVAILPTQRYFYLIGPGMIETFTRTYEWQPPQKSQEITAWSNKRAEDAGIKRGRNLREGANPDSARLNSADSAISPSAVYGSRTTEEVRSANNFDGPKKQDIFSKEKEAKLSLSVLMCPALTGIKPLDILYIPSLREGFMEDWIVSSIEYQQDSNGVSISIQATRKYGIKGSMKPYAGSVARNEAEKAGLIGYKGSLIGSWTKFAWELGVKKSPLDTPKSSPSPTSPPKDWKDMTEEERVKDFIMEYDSENPPLNSNDAFTEIKKGTNTTTYRSNDKLFWSYLRLNLVKGVTDISPKDGATVVVTEVNKEGYSITIENKGGQGLQSLISLYNYWKSTPERELILREVATRSVKREMELNNSPQTPPSPTTGGQNPAQQQNLRTGATNSSSPLTPQSPSPIGTSAVALAVEEPISLSSPQGAPQPQQPPQPSQSQKPKQPQQPLGTPTLPVIGVNGQVSEPLNFSNIPFEVAGGLARGPSQSPTKAIIPVTLANGSKGIQINDPLFAIYLAPTLVRDNLIGQSEVYRAISYGSPVSFPVPPSNEGNLIDQLRRDYATAYSTYKKDLESYADYQNKRKMK